MMGIPHAKVVRGISMFETSMIYIIFDDGTDLYWARSRVLEYLNFVKDRLPAGVEPKLGPDATGRRMGLSIRPLSRLLFARLIPRDFGTMSRPTNGTPIPIRPRPIGKAN